MFQSLLSVVSLILIIILGWWLRRLRIFPKSAQKNLSKIMIYLTLPGAVIYAFAGASLDASTGLIALLGLATAALPMLLSVPLTRGLHKNLRIYSMINSAGFNIGCFALPFIMNTFGPAGAAIAIMFDAGNSLVVCGGSYALATALFGQKMRKRDITRSILRELSKSPPFLTSLTMLIWVLTGIPIPTALTTLTKPIATANAFIAMLLLGLMFKADFSPVKIRSATLVIFLRLVSSAASVALVYYFLPYPVEVRYAIMLALVSPITSLGPIFTDRAGADSSLASFTGSFSIPISVIIITVMIVSMTAG